ncbi:glycoside hydrolase family 3 N-terminal domain-containing protein, partial [Bacteroides reticulotermitis]|uniref:glycoside hydrolase family 3 N-terminal domain-containing protein n=1 Tax=Bacteroides reticulotermitis TaxID=1133319 RepID=UPI003A8ABCE1
MKKLILCTFIPFLISCQPTQNVDTSIYMDAKLPVDKRVEALLGQMTLKEKIAQMDMVTVWDREAIFKNGYYDFGAWLADLEPEESNQLQKLSEQTRLKIPYLIGMDAAHGYAMLTGRTVFPTSISMAATFNRELVLRTTTKAGEEIRSAGTHWAFAPCIDIVQDARWGRTGETYGEDPFLTSELVKEAVRGYQGNEDPLKRVAVSVKHLVGGGASVGGCNHASAELSERALRSYFLPPFKAAIEAGCMTIMPGHNDIAGVPVHASKWLLTDLIKKEYDFKGFFISDMGDVGNLAASLHQVAENQKEAIRMSINAGLDMHMYSADSMRFVAPLIELVQEKKVSQERIDDAVRRILKIKFELGLFENRYVSPEKDNYGSKENKDLALEAAREAIVLLKNKQQILPLDKNKYKKILVTGPNADNQSILGDWSIFQPDDHVTTILEGIQTLASPEQSITYSNSGRIKAQKSDLSVNTTDPAIQQRLITEGGGISDFSINDAVRKAKQADLAVVAIGGYGIRTEWGLRTYGESADRPSIDFYGRQLELVQAIYKTGTPIVIVIINGKPLNNEWITENIATIVDVWEPGMYGGQALAEILFGEVNPSGKLPITIPKHAGQIPMYYYQRPSRYWTGYGLGSSRADDKPAFCFGHGLSYSTYEYSDLKVDSLIPANKDVEVTFTVKNTGKMAGKETALLFVRDCVSSV